MVFPLEIQQDPEPVSTLLSSLIMKNSDSNGIYILRGTWFIYFDSHNRRAGGVGVGKRRQS